MEEKSKEIKKSYTPPPVPDKTMPLSVDLADFLQKKGKTPDGKFCRIAGFYVGDCYNRQYVVFVNSLSPFFDVLIQCWKSDRHVRIDADFMFSKTCWYHSVTNVRNVEVLTDAEETEWTFRKKVLFDTEWRRQYGKRKSYKKAPRNSIANEDVYKDA